jgi:hypothetical protein
MVHERLFSSLLSSAQFPSILLVSLQVSTHPISLCEKKEREKEEEKERDG